MVRVTCYNSIGSSSSRPHRWDPDVKPWLGEEEPGKAVVMHAINKEPLRFPLHLFYLPITLMKGTPVN